MANCELDANEFPITPSPLDISFDARNLAVILLLVMVWGLGVPAVTAWSAEDGASSSLQKMVDDFEAYRGNDQLGKAWYKPHHGAPLKLTLESAEIGGGRQSLKIEYATTAAAETHYAPFCRVARWDLSGCQAVKFWLKPDGSGRQLTFELNAANREGDNIHDLWSYKISLDKGDTNPRWVTIPFSRLTHNTKFADSTETNPVFLPGGVIEVAFYIGGRNDEPGEGVYLIDEITAVGDPQLAGSDNWPQFRGRNGQGRSTELNLPLKWTATENIAWRTPVPGESWSSPIVWQDRVFLTTATEEGKSCRVLAIDRKSGSVLWDREVFQQDLKRKEDRNSYATPTPATDGERIYACFGDGSFAAVDWDGNVVWTNRDYPFYGQHGLGTSPILHDGLLIMARDGSSDGDDKKLGWQTPWDQSYVLALDAKTGQERWKGRRGLSRISHGVPCIWEHTGQAQVVSEAGDVVQGFDIRTGERLWSSEVAGEGKVPSTVLGPGMVFTAGGWGGKETIKAFKLGVKGDSGESNLVWEQKKGMPKVPSMVYVPPYLFAVTDGGVATCLRAETGELVWQERLGGNFSASPVAADGRVYFVADNGDTTVVEAGPKFQVLAKNPLDEKVQASPAISHGQILIRTEKQLICIGAP
ncbi:MAG: PQQ-binding-like beta-propeller repeat protein [Pirellulales bacterium]